MNTCLFSQQKLTSFTEKKGVIKYEFPQHPCPHSITYYKPDPPLTTHNLTKAKMLSQCPFTAKRVTFIKFPQTSVKTPKDNHQFIQLLFKNNKNFPQKGVTLGMKLKTIQKKTKWLLF